MKDDEIKPKDHSEAMAVFRAQAIGSLVCRADWTHGELAQELRALSRQPVRPPHSNHSRRYGASTLERWYYLWRRGGLTALRPQRRSDCGHAGALTEEQRQLVLDIRRQNPRVAVTVILRTLIEDGRLQVGQISDTTLRRFFKANGLSRAALRRQTDGGRERRRWQAARPHEVWHADVMHGPALKIGGKAAPLRIHALLDDRTRYVLAIQAFSTERESDMLTLMVKATRKHGSPKTLYLDNGPTYVGETLRVACSRLNTNVVHAKPYDPQARGKMERFWRTLRDQCVSHMGTMSSLHDVQVRLLSWLDRHYLIAPHAGLLGRSPANVLSEELRDGDSSPVSEKLLHEALTIRCSRQLRGDGTMDIAGVAFELAEGFLAGKKVTAGRSLLNPTDSPWVEHDGRRFELRRVDVVANGRRPRGKRRKRGIDAVPFDPPGALLRSHTTEKGPKS